MEDYQEIRHIGRGAFGEVVLARHKLDGNLVAVKRIRHMGEFTSEMYSESMKEVRVLQAMQHPSILQFFHSIDDGETVSLVTEYADAGDLQHLLRWCTDRKQRLEDLTALAIFAQLADAVKHVHSKRVLHRDLKPSNILLTSRGMIKLGDFGVAKLVAGTAAYDKMTCVGSPIYMAPEVVGGEPYGPACDVWSSGVILYELCTLRKPFEGRSLGEVAMRIMTGTYKPLEDSDASTCSEFAQPLLSKMLILEVAERATMQEIVQAPILRMLSASAAGCSACVARLLQDKASNGLSSQDADLQSSLTKGSLQAQLGDTIATLDATAIVADALQSETIGAVDEESCSLGSTLLGASIRRPSPPPQDAGSTFNSESLKDLLSGALHLDSVGPALEGTSLTQLDPEALAQMSDFARAAGAQKVTKALDASGLVSTAANEDPKPVRQVEPSSDARGGVSNGAPSVPTVLESSPSVSSTFDPRASPLQKVALDPRDTQAGSRILRLDRGSLSSTTVAVERPPTGEVQDERLRQRQRARMSRGSSAGSPGTPCGTPPGAPGFGPLGPPNSSSPGS
eukprot:TRINITY_DN46395_c0_g1_i1.p1 TRINITY_DN46395_c0_g1~~TRINITY_DN46395_c0_g1_i1.p1  ORF type:complete len:567 (+),score=81.17 TRINITY_DN46395_c0_g1_i1:177-1877(+)